MKIATTTMAPKRITKKEKKEKKEKKDKKEKPPKSGKKRRLVVPDLSSDEDGAIGDGGEKMAKLATPSPPSL